MSTTSSIYNRLIAGIVIQCVGAAVLLVIGFSNAQARDYERPSRYESRDRYERRVEPRDHRHERYTPTYRRPVQFRDPQWRRNDERGRPASGAYQRFESRTYRD